MSSIFDILSAQDRLKGHVHVTPIMTSEMIDKLADCKVFFKCEHLQKTGSFKARGACNAVRKTLEEGTANGVVTHSSGNHGGGLAWAAKRFNLPCTVVVPTNAPDSKVEAIEAYGAKIVRCEPTAKSRSETSAKLAEELNYAFVHPNDDCTIIAGQGTIAIEILSQVPDVDAIFLAVGGGGMASGVVDYVKHTKPEVKVYLVEPEGKHLGDYLNGGECRTDIGALDTIADGIRVLKVGVNNYPLLKKYCKESVITVNEEEIKEGCRLVWSRLKQRVEPTAGVPLAGLLKLQKESDVLRGKKVAIILCGGNCDIDFVPL